MKAKRDHTENETAADLAATATVEVAEEKETIQTREDLEQRVEELNTLLWAERHLTFRYFSRVGFFRLENRELFGLAKIIGRACADANQPNWMAGNDVRSLLENLQDKLDKLAEESESTITYAHNLKNRVEAATRHLNG